MSDIEQCAIADLIGQVNDLEQKLLEAKANQLQSAIENFHILKNANAEHALSIAPTNAQSLALHDADVIEQAMPDRATVDNCNYSNAFRIGWNTCLKEFSVLVDNLRNSVKGGEG